MIRILYYSVHTLVFCHRIRLLLKDEGLIKSGTSEYHLRIQKYKILSKARVEASVTVIPFQ